MKTMPTRLPDHVLEGKHQATPDFQIDRTIPEDTTLHVDQRWELEQWRRDRRNRLIVANLTEGLTVFYMSSGSSMWPLVQSNDACLFHPIQAVTGAGFIQKAESDIDVGDIVFCQVQPSNQYYAHLVLEIEKRS